ncbi:hypothetical protein Misp01_77960 [Microtetraspora sp. NBRC 13810]|uniref:TauD/TfdA family dioxygenase n=1 Tax=Microtetraspora sp. NBRC 13810 TaxID=3030990 RepID=UPI0024A52684|nr:TauD/TfdA family dioxygenase [Microtetraspora sp. NBRC 13810]GLW12668.1 hypothetical protein Misp01_77960 [Microtetraspora sp. NBRC 13810]
MTASTPTTFTTGRPRWQQHRPGPFGLLLTGDGTIGLDDLPPAALLQLVAQEHLLILRGLPTVLTCEEFEEFGCALGEPILWSDRPAFFVQAQPDPDSYIFETGFMPIHWDGVSAEEQTPDLQIFQCVQAVEAEVGGATLFCDTRQPHPAAHPPALSPRHATPATPHHHPAHDQARVNGACAVTEEAGAHRRAARTSAG